ncbi:hypothetical protein Nepgr_018415 [Nepenthes gracilis]|uniref:Uncharacterized protein n=1 Tax=Nepenthes gracilis TaxID=150966 RepID=A0AAD3XU04_NEPGR|nr:hypothetical protein Nepgr_018415 [Nepenthes gracilis]
MEMEASPEVIAKRLWNVIRMAFLMLGKGVSKSKLIYDLYLMLKRSNKVAGKAIGSLMLHQNALSCKSNDVRLSFVSPVVKEYEFSCSNSPAYPFHRVSNNNNWRTKGAHHYINHHRYRYRIDDAATAVTAVQRVLEMLNNEAEVAGSPLALPGFGKSPAVRQLRVTDSPFPLKESEEERIQVSKAADEFIKKFYRDLKMQKSMAAIESPYHGRWGS